MCSTVGDPNKNIKRMEIQLVIRSRARLQNASRILEDEIFAEGDIYYEICTVRVAGYTINTAINEVCGVYDRDISVSEVQFH